MEFSPYPDMPTPETQEKKSGDSTKNSEIPFFPDQDY